MKCEEAEAKMIDYIDDELDSVSRQEIEKHLETCEECTDCLNETQRVTKLISSEKESKPDASLRISFYDMLHAETQQGEENKKRVISNQATRFPKNIWMGIAAGIALLIGGTFIGFFIHSGVERSAEIKMLQAEVSELKRNTMFAMFRESSSSDRLQAVSYTQEFENPDQKIIEVLFNTLNTDRNINVRMAAAYALSKFASQPEVSDSLVHSLTLQQDPILQITLINILAERKEKNALNPIMEIIANKNTINEVRVVAQNSLRALI